MLKPGTALSSSFDPLYYCFGAGERALVAGARITPHFGRRDSVVARSATAAAEVVARPVAGDAQPLLSVVGTPVVLDTSAGIGKATPAPVPAPGGLVLEMARGSDARNERAVTAAVRLVNPSRSPAIVYFRRALLTFEVHGPQGVAHCIPETESRHPARRGFTRLGPESSATLVSRLVELCPRGTFARAGVYWVGAELDTSADGGSVGLEAVTGQFRTSRPALVRVRRSIRLFPSRPVAGVNGTTPAVPVGAGTAVRASTAAPARPAPARR